MFKKEMSVLNWLVISGLVVCNVLLIKQNVELRETVEQHEREKRVQVGDIFNDFKAANKNNEPVDFVSDQTKKKLLLFSSTTCPFCEKQTPYWKQFLKQTDINNYKIYFLFNNREDISKVNEYLETNGFMSDGNSVTPLFSDNETLRKYKLNGTPTTLIINGAGIVEKSWSGLWDRATISEVEDYFHIAID